MCVYTCRQSMVMCTRYPWSFPLCEIWSDAIHFIVKLEIFDCVWDREATGSECRNTWRVFPSADACYILSFAIIMLNTSLHNPNVKNKVWPFVYL